MKENQPQIIPVLRILDVAKAKEFYIDWLGFVIDWEHRFGENFPLYMQVSLNNIVFHLTEHYGDCLPGARVRVSITAIETFHQQLKEYKYYKPAVKQPEWETKELSLIDPFGNHIVFFEELNE